MSNEIQKQYKRCEDVWSIMHRKKDLYAVSDRHIRYAVTKAFFGARMIEGSSVREHGLMMLSLVEKLKDLQADFEKKEMYVDVIPQSLPPSYDQFIVNYNMNGLEKSLHELINMLVQYEQRLKNLRHRRGKGKRKRVRQSKIQMMSAFIAERRAIGRGSVLSSSPMKVKMRSKKPKQEGPLKFSDSRAIAAKTRDLVRISGYHVRINIYVT
ncbi:UNVERIFIED_CONTAM: hypothetical protein Scaly_2827100 [Sesamum calycinum]|uniref:Uncharacterized protein n=1 Tax=Sesamum calycinum TaxID=2727403 RepID=A0AAW2ITX6_9LAMI